MINLPPRFSTPMTFGVFAPSGAVDQVRLKRGISSRRQRHRVVVSPETESNGAISPAPMNSGLPDFTAKSQTPASMS